MVTSIEQHVDWISNCLVALQERGVAVIEAKSESESAWTQTLEEVAKPTAFYWGCDNSWYKGANIVGKPQVFMPYVGGVGQYRAIADAEAASGYPGFLLRDTEGQIVRATMFESLTALPRQLAYRGSNMVKVLRMLLSRGGKNSLVGAAWPDAQVRSRL